MVFSNSEIAPSIWRIKVDVGVSSRNASGRFTLSLSPREWRSRETVMLTGIKPRVLPSCSHQIRK